MVVNHINTIIYTESHHARILAAEGLVPEYHGTLAQKVVITHSFAFLGHILLCATFEVAILLVALRSYYALQKQLFLLAASRSVLYCVRTNQLVNRREHTL